MHIFVLELDVDQDGHRQLCQHHGRCKYLYLKF